MKMGMVKQSLIFGLTFLSWNVLSQTTDQKKEIRTYKSLDIVFVDNNQSDQSSGAGLTGGQLIFLSELTDSIAYKQNTNQTCYLFYECNGPNPFINLDLKSRKRYIADLQEHAYNAPPNFSIDQTLIFAQLESLGEFQVTDEINLYFFFQSRYYSENKFGNVKEIVKFLNLLPREIAAINNFKADRINITVCLPSNIQNFDVAEIENKLKLVHNFKSNGDFYAKTFFDVRIAN